jgi:hypothetical protein
MIAEIDLMGALVIQAENSTEGYALRQWWKDYTPNEDSFSYVKGFIKKDNGEKCPLEMKIVYGGGS